MNNENDLYAAGRLIHWALRPTERPTAQSEYRELLARYLENLQFRDIVWAIASGLGLYIINASSLGIVLAPLEGSIFMPKASDYRPSGSAEERLLDGLIHIAIIATIYPRAQDLEEDTVIARLPITIEAVEATLQDICHRLEETSREQPDPTVADRAAGLYEAWRVYREKASVKATENARVSPTTTRRMIEQGLEFLRKQGCFTLRSQGNSQEYQPTWRYQIMIQEWSATHIYDVIRSLLESPTRQKEV